MPIIIRAEYLSYYNPVRNSDKLFNVFLVRNDEGTYSCLTENGRRGSKLVCRIVCEDVRRETAEQRFWEKVREKRNHEATPYTNESFGSGYSQIASEFPFQISANNESPKNSPNPGQKQENVIVFPVEKANAKKPNTGGLLNSDQFDSLEL